MAEFYVGQVSEHAIIFNEFGEILLLQHKREPHTGKWHFVGGRLDIDDVPGKALQREIAEETGIEGVELIMPCHASRWGFDVPEKYSVAYLARAKGRPEAVLPDHDDHGAARWVPWREALGLTFIHPKQPSVLADVIACAKRLGVLDELS